MALLDYIIVDVELMLAFGAFGAFVGVFETP
jgi:hypothetical protein